MKTSFFSKFLCATIFAVTAHAGTLQAATLVNIDFGTQLTNSPGTWNNVTTHTAMGDKADLLDTTGVSTGIAMNISSGSFGGVSTASMTSDSAMFDAFEPSTVIGDFAFVSAGSTGTLAFTGLNASLTYNLTMTGARSEAAERFTRYTVTGFGSPVILQTSGDNPFAGTGNATYNNDDFVTFTGITGVTSFNLTVTGNTQADFAGSDAFGYINALQLEIVPEPSAIGLLGLGAIGLLARRRR